MSKLKYVVVGVLLVGSLGFLVAMKFLDNMAYEIPVSEFLQKKDHLGDRGVRVNGKLTEGTHHIEIVPDGARHTFTMEDKENPDLKMDVVFIGPAPDTMRETFELTVEGKLRPDGVFQASHITPKCASKYDQTYDATAEGTS